MHWRDANPRVGHTEFVGKRAVATEEILQQFPYLEPEDISACLEYAARHVDQPVARTA